MNNKIKVTAFVTGSIAVAGITTIQTIKAIQHQKKATDEAIKNSQLDIQAINIAADVVKVRIDRGEIRSLEQLAKNLRTEIDFQKIAIREDI